MAVTADRSSVPGRVPHGAAVVGGCVLTALLAAAVLGRSAAPYDPDQVSAAVSHYRCRRQAGAVLGPRQAFPTPGMHVDACQFAVFLLPDAQCHGGGS